MAVAAASHNPEAVRLMLVYHHRCLTLLHLYSWYGLLRHRDPSSSFKFSTHC